MKNLIQALLLITIMVCACTPENEIIDDGPIQPLVFSADTILFDTIVTSVSSINKRLIVRNPNKKAVNISHVEIGSGNMSQYSLYLNGIKGNTFENEFLRGNDSLLILVEVYIDPQDEDLPFLVKDSIRFNTNNILQDVKLISYGQDANFLNDSILACNTIWDSPKPYVITNSILVDTLCNLTIKEGVRVYSDTRSFIFIKGNITVEGSNEFPVQFLNTRFDEKFENAPGQWGGIIFLPGSKDNFMDFGVIRNAEVGLNLDTYDVDQIPEILVTNTIIENMSASGILTIGADIEAANVVINNCGDFLVGNFGGGFISYIHCTFSNSNTDFFRQNPSIVFTDDFNQGEIMLESELNLNLVNSIAWGNLDEELFIGTKEQTGSSIFVANSILKTLIDLNINDNQLNINPNFIDPVLYNFRLDTLSPAKDSGILTPVTIDLDGNLRDEFPDIGAYERIEND